MTSGASVTIKLLIISYKISFYISDLVIFNKNASQGGDSSS